jgi:hypothetical protein
VAFFVELGDEIKVASTAEPALSMRPFSLRISRINASIGAGSPWDSRR